MTDNPARGGLATPVPKNSGRFIVDIRLFVVSITVAMCGAFFAGVTMGPSGASSPLTNVLVQQEMSSPHPSPLHLSEGVISESLKHSPSGQHLLVDIANVDAAFLNSEERLTEAMVQTVRETGLTMLSYHCHQLSPAGISCVGVLMESHISFHTWPDEGVITLDLFTCGPIALLPNAIHTMQRLFGVPRYEEESVRVKWSHELRGFRPEEHKSNNAIDAYSDLSSSILSPLDLHSKTQVYSNLTQYQRVDIWDVVEVRTKLLFLYSI